MTKRKNQDPGPGVWQASARELGATLDVSLRALGDTAAPIGRALAARTLTRAWPRMWDTPAEVTAPIRGELVRVADADTLPGRVIAQRASRRRSGWRWW